MGGSGRISDNEGLVMFDLKEYLDVRRKIIDAALDKELPGDDLPPALLHKAMRYSVFSGGKRLRPIICTASAEAVGAPCEAAIKPAVALELFHAYTLIHDDLPCMDDDKFRRGKPTCHVMFGEANAVLAGDALQALAFEALAKADGLSRYPISRLVGELARAGGSRGVVGGQVEDIAIADGKADANMIEYVHTHKTACLFRAAAALGGMAGDAEEDQLGALAEYGLNLGMAFQIADDLLDAAADTTDACASVESALPDGKNKSVSCSCLSVYGVQGAKQRAEQFITKSISAVRKLNGPGVEPLVAIARYVVERVC